MIPSDHPRYRSLVVRERLAACAQAGIVSLEGLTAHGRGEAFDYLLGERTTESALLAERTAAALFRLARSPVISVNGNTAALAAAEIAALQETCGALVEVNLFHRIPGRMERVTGFLEDHGVKVLSGEPVRCLPLLHDRGLCIPEGIGSADLVLVPLEDGDRCGALVQAGKKVIAVDLNPLSRTARTATLTIVDEVTRALPAIREACKSLSAEEAAGLLPGPGNNYFLKAAMDEISRRLSHALD